MNNESVMNQHKELLNEFNSRINKEVVGLVKSFSEMFAQTVQAVLSQDLKQENTVVEKSSMLPDIRGHTKKQMIRHPDGSVLDKNAKKVFAQTLKDRAGKIICEIRFMEALTNEEKNIVKDFCNLGESVLHCFQKIFELKTLLLRSQAKIRVAQEQISVHKVSDEEGVWKLQQAQMGKKEGTAKKRIQLPDCKLQRHRIIGESASEINITENLVEISESCSQMIGKRAHIIIRKNEGVFKLRKDIKGKLKWEKNFLVKSSILPNIHSAAGTLNSIDKSKPSLKQSSYRAAFLKSFNKVPLPSQKPYFMLELNVTDQFVGEIHFYQKLLSKEKTQVKVMCHLRESIVCSSLEIHELQDKLRNSEAERRVTDKELWLCRVCDEKDVEMLKEMMDKEENAIVKSIRSLDFDGTNLNGLQSPQYVTYMLNTLRGNAFTMDNEVLCRFVLTVQKNYRKVIYHNWDHGWSVAHAMFVFLGKIKGIFNQHERVALFVACLCHDIDHRGRDNRFMEETQNPLFTLYNSTSTMETHHFRETAAILKLDSHNIFSSLSREDYKKILKLIEFAILATDLKVFFDNKDEFARISANGQFNVGNPVHRALFQSVLMTCCDLNSAAKPLMIHFRTAKNIILEFYEQGSEEKMQGREPKPIMDSKYLPALTMQQTDFLRKVACDAFRHISFSGIVKVSELIWNCDFNANVWEKSEVSKGEEEEEESDRAVSSLRICVPLLKELLELQPSGTPPKWVKTLKHQPDLFNQ